MSQSTVVSVGNTPTANGGAWQPHVFYDSVNNLYWAFTLTATSTTTLYTYSSPDGSTWTARATATLSVAPTDGRNLSVAYKAISGTAVVHVTYFDGTGGTINAYHLRGTISGTTITWGSSVADSSLVSPGAILGVATCLDSNNKPLDWWAGGNNGDVQAFYSANADSGSSWTTGMGSGTDAGVGTNNIASGCLIPLSNGNVVTLCDDGGGATFPTASLTNVHTGKHSSSGFTASGSLASVFTTLGAAQDTNTWNACYVSDTAVHCVLASGTNTWTEKLLNGSSTGNTTAPTVSAGSSIPNQTFKATGGVAMIYNANTSTLYLFCIDSATGNDVRVISWTSGGGWGSWAGLGLASATRNYLSCAPQLDANGNVQLYWVEGSGSPYSLCTTQYATAGWKVVQNPVVKINSNSVATNPLQSAAPTVATTAGNSLMTVIWGWDLGGATIAVTDSAGNSHTVNQSTIPATGAGVAIASAHNTLAVPTSTGWFKVSITGAASTTYWGFFVLECAPPSGVGSLDVGANGTQGSLATPSAGPTGSIAGGNEIAIQAAAFQFNAATATSVSTWTAGTKDGPISAVAGASAYELINTTGTITGAQITANGTVTTSVAVVAVYKTVATDPFPAGYGHVPLVVFRQVMS